jgi:acetyl-CoA carboxylase carboxyltransferase component
MAGQGFDPDFIFTWPSGRMGVMEGESAILAVHGPALEKAAREKKAPSEDVREAVDAMREDYEHQLDARYAAARGYVDAIIHPEETAQVLAMALHTAMHNEGPHLGAFVLPPQPGPAR